MSAYSATKGAVDTLVKHFAFALGARGIRVNAVAPGVVETDMSNFTKTEAGRDFTLGMQALKRLAQPDDIGGVIAFLASEDARWITGHTVRVDGGSNSDPKMRRLNPHIIRGAEPMSAVSILARRMRRVAGLHEVEGLLITSL